MFNKIQKSISILLVLSSVILIGILFWSGHHYEDLSNHNGGSFPHGTHPILWHLDRVDKNGTIHYHWSSLDALLYAIPAGLGVANWFTPYEQWIRKYKWRKQWTK